MTRKERQEAVSRWCIECFGIDHATSLPQRGLRFLEEAIETAQAVDVPLATARKLLDYIYSRPKGQLRNELGGVGVTLLALASAASLSAEECERVEVERVLSKPRELFTARNEEKNAAGFNITGPVNPVEKGKPVPILSGWSPGQIYYSDDLQVTDEGIAPLGDKGIEGDDGAKLPTLTRRYLIEERNRARRYSSICTKSEWNTEWRGWANGITAILNRPYLLEAIEKDFNLREAQIGNQIGRNGGLDIAAELCDQAATGWNFVAALHLIPEAVGASARADEALRLREQILAHKVEATKPDAAPSGLGWWRPKSEDLL